MHPLPLGEGEETARRVIRFPTWDHMMLPLPFTRGVLICREWAETVPRKADPEQTESLRRALESALDTVTDEADALCKQRRYGAG